MDLKNFQSALSIWYSNLNLPIKSSRTSQSRINTLGPIRSPKNDYIPAFGHAVHERKQLCNNSLFYISKCFFSFWRNSIYFINKNYTRSRIPCLFKDVP